MSVGKKQLREHMAEQFKNRRAEIRKELRANVRQAVDLVLAKEFSGGKELARKAGEMADAISNYYQKYDIYMDWHLTAAVKELNELDPYENLAKVQTSMLFGNLLDGEGNTVRDEFCYVEEELRSAGDAAKNQIKQLSTLEGEIASVITAAPNGAKAYERLVELGVDLTGLASAPALLPAVVKLSVDPSIMKG